MNDPNTVVYRAISFAAHAHRHQVRKDGRVPYVAHVFRAAYIVGQVFGVADPLVIAAAVLHDVIEDTPTDFDDVADVAGEDVARWVSALSKDMRFPDAEREPAYLATLAAAPWQVSVCKLADVYDNLNDAAGLPPEGRLKNLRRATEYLAALKPTLPPEAERAFALTAALRDRVAGSLASC